MPDWFIGLLTIAVTLALGLLTWQATRRSGDRERIKQLEERQDNQDRRNLRWQNYANMLRQHIDDGKPPPAPDFPDGLFD